MKRVIVVCGKLCSGKTTFARTLAIHHRHVEVGDIVRRLTQTQERIHKADFDVEIRTELLTEIDKGDNIIITGIRQLSILTPVLFRIGTEQGEIIWLEVSEEERAKRFIQRDDTSRDIATFEQYDERDHALGLGEVEVWLKNIYRWTKIVNNE